MSLSSAQKTLLVNAIAADGTLNTLPPGADSALQIASAFTVQASPDFWVWRTNVSRSDIYNNVSADATTWSWSTYKSQNATEQNAWTQMFMGDLANFAQANLRAGVAAIFTGSAPQNAQQAHVLAIGRRLATRIEKLLATGTGSSAVPAVMGFEGPLSYQDVLDAKGW